MFKKFKESREVVRKIENLLGLSPSRVWPFLDAGYLPRGDIIFLSFLGEKLETIIEEIRHRIQCLDKVELLSFENIDDFPAEIKEKIRKKIKDDIDEKHELHLKEEIDAKIVAVIGEILFKEGKIEEFKNLMLFSKLPSFFIFEKIKE